MDKINDLYWGLFDIEYSNLPLILDCLMRHCLICTCIRNKKRDKISGKHMDQLGLKPGPSDH